MKTTNEDFNKYLIETKRPDSDFICNECGCDMLDLDDIESNFKLRNSKKDIFTRIIYSENEQNAFLIRGRVINGKRYHRQICWDCFFKLRELNFDCAKLSRKNKWWSERRVLNRDMPTPKRNLYQSMVNTKARSNGMNIVPDKGILLHPNTSRQGKICQMKKLKHSTAVEHVLKLILLNVMVKKKAQQNGKHIVILKHMQVTS